MERTKHEDKTNWNVSFRTGREWITARYLYLKNAFPITLTCKSNLSNLFSLGVLLCHLYIYTYRYSLHMSNGLILSLLGGKLPSMYSSILLLSLFLFYLFSAVSPVTHRTSPKPRSVFSHFIFRSVVMYVFIYLFFYLFVFFFVCVSHFCPSFRTVLCCRLYFVVVKAIVLFIASIKLWTPWAQFLPVFWFLFLFQKLR